MKKRITAVLLSIFIVFSVMPVVFANSAPTIRVSSATAQPGDTVTLSVSLENNPGINTFSLGFNYDTTRLNLTNVALTSNLGGQFTYAKKAVWLNSTDTTYNGELLILTFDVLETAAVGDAAVAVSYNSGDIANYNEDDVDFTLVAGKVTVTNPAAQTGTITVGTAEAQPGESVNLVVSIADNPGINTFSLSFNYDTSRLNLTNVALTSNLGGQFTYTRKAVWLNSTDTTYNGELLILTFDVLQTAAEGDATVAVSYNSGDIANYNEDDVDFTLVAGKVTVTNPAAQTGTITVGTAEAQPGDSVNLVVSIADNPGINTFSFSFNYDTTRLSLTNVALTSNLGGQFTYVRKAVWLNGTDTTYNGELLILTFDVLETAAVGDAAVAVSYNSGDIANYNEDDVNFALVAGKVTVLAAHEHNYILTETIPATCSQEGQSIYTCECGNSYTEPIAKLPHTPTTVVSVPATCTGTGLQHSECEICGERLSEDVVIPAKGHTYSEWVMSVNPTTTTTGKMCRHCTDCGVMLDEMTVPMLIDDRVTGISISSSKEYLNRNASLTLTAVVTPSTALDKTVLWTSSEPDVATVENGIVTAVAPGITVIIAQTADCGYKDFCVVQVNAVSPQNGSVIDNGVITGLSVNMNSLDSYLSLDDETMTIEYSTDVIGTGTKVLVKQGDTVVNEFETVVFGDVDGDSWYNGTDAYFVGLVVNGMIPASALTDAQRMAADCNHDGIIDAADVALLEQAGLLLAQVDQTLPSEKLQTNNVYLEYCGLIDQSIEINEPDQPAVTEEPAAEQGSAANVWQIILDLFKRLVNFVTMIFSIIVIPK